MIFYSWVSANIWWVRNANKWVRELRSSVGHTVNWAPKSNVT